MGQPSNTVRQQESSVNSRKPDHQPPGFTEGAQNKPTTPNALTQMSQQSFCRMPSPTNQYSQQPRRPLAPAPPPNRPSTHSVQSQKNGWKFTNSFGPQKTPLERQMKTNPPQAVQPAQSQVVNYTLIYKEVRLC